MCSFTALLTNSFHKPNKRKLGFFFIHTSNGYQTIAVLFEIIDNTSIFLQPMYTIIIYHK